jgi:hypothetical protein
MTRRFNAWLWAASAVLCTGTVGVGVPVLAESSRVVSVEEHWELQVAEPDLGRSAPQTTMVMSPTSDLSGKHFLFTLNHWSAPDYAAGGMEIQLWDGDGSAQATASNKFAAFANSNETVTWTQRLSVHDGVLKFEIADGQSQTWGEFGGTEDLSMETPTELTALNSYHPSVSLNESQVSYAENRVHSLTLKKLVWVTEDGQVHEQDAPIPLDITLGGE